MKRKKVPEGPVYDHTYRGYYARTWPQKLIDGLRYKRMVERRAKPAGPNREKRRRHLQRPQPRAVTSREAETFRAMAYIVISNSAV